MSIQKNTNPNHVAIIPAHIAKLGLKPRAFMLYCHMAGLADKSRNQVWVNQKAWAKDLNC